MIRPVRTLLLAGSALAWTLGALAAAPTTGPVARYLVDLTTVAERSGYVRTGRYDEVAHLCHAYAERWPAWVRCMEFGRTPENRPMLALVASDDGALDPTTVRDRKRPVALFQGRIHAGEIDGKDAGFKVLRELLVGREQRGALSRVTVVFVPVTTWTVTSASVAATARTSAVPRRWAGEPRPRTSTSIAKT